MRLPADVRALTLRQPFAWAVIKGFKSVENRGYLPPQAMIGQLIAIHAGVARVDDGDCAWVKSRARTRMPDELDVGAIVGLVRLVAAVRGPRSLTRQQRRWYVPGSCAWILDDVIELESPIGCTGQLGFWQIKGRPLRALRAQVRARPRSKVRTLNG